MVQTQLLRRRSWAGIAGLIVISIAVLVALALGNTIVLLATLAVAALAGILALRERAPALTSVAAATPARVGAEPRTQRAVLAADGSPRQALVVPAESTTGYQTVLTIDGYALINAEGRIIYALNRELHAEANEPVAVTILDAEAESNEPVMVSVSDLDAVAAS